MSLPPLDWDLGLFGPDLLDGTDPPAQIGASGDLGSKIMSEWLAAQVTVESGHVEVSRSAGLGLTNAVVGNESEHVDDTSESSASPPPPSLSQCSIAQTDSSGDTNQEEEESPEARRLQLRALESRLFRKRKKNETEELRKEVAMLAEQLERLRDSLKKARGDDGAAEWEERAIVHRRRLGQSEELNAKLKRAIYDQRGLVHGLMGCLSSSPLLGSELNLQRILHTYIHLGLSPHARLRAFQSVCSGPRLDLALQVIDRETKGVPFDSPNISTQRLQTLPTECGTNSVAVYAFQTTDVRKVFQNACLAIAGSKFGKTRGVTENVCGDVVDSPASQVQYSISHGVFTSDATGEEFRVALRIVSFTHITDEHALLLWDYVDVDDLNPVRQDTHIKCDFVGAMLVRREVCADGVQRVVCRHISTKLHRLSATTLTSSLERNILSGAQLCTQRVYMLIRELTLAQQARQLRASPRRSPCPIRLE